MAPGDRAQCNSTRGAQLIVAVTEVHRVAKIACFDVSKLPVYNLVTCRERLGMSFG